MDDSRFMPEPRREHDPRSPYRLDRDRILYAGHFARLAEITQVVSPEQGYVFHNRLTHSLKVAQIARTIAEIFCSDFATEIAPFGGIDPDAAEAAGLAHDLGHPPFGHIAEEELNRLVRLAGLADGFEGNAQSFRIVCRLAVSDAQTGADGGVDSLPGLNLTRSTLAGILKYPWGHGENADKPNKWGYYEDERPVFDWARHGTPVGQEFQKTLIAEVMDWADDITYAIHDLLDFYRAGLIPLELVRQTSQGTGGSERRKFLEGMFTRKPQWADQRAGYEAALDRILDPLPFDVSHKYTGDTGEEQTLYQFSTTLISRYVNAIKPSVGTSQNVVIIPDDIRAQVDILKQFIWHYVILNPALAQVQLGQRRAIRRVFRDSLRASRDKELHFFPEPHRSRLRACTTDRDLVRLAADYVAGMTERELIAACRRFEGHAER